MRLIDADALKTYEQLEPIKFHPVVTYSPISRIPLNTIGKGLGETTDNVQPVKRGKWLYDDIADEYRCSVCDIPSTLATPYCPWCGTKMDMEGENHE